MIEELNCDGENLKLKGKVRATLVKNEDASRETKERVHSKYTVACV